MSLFKLDSNGNSGSYQVIAGVSLGKKEVIPHSKRECSNGSMSDKDIYDGILMFQTEQDPIGS